MKISNQDMQNFRVKFVMISVCFLFLSSISYSQTVKDKLLHGKIFTVEQNIKGAKKPKPMADELSFKTGKFNSKLMKTESQHKPGNYTVTVDSTSAEKIISFECETTNPKGEILHWTGTITGEAIEGNAILKVKEKVKKEYTYSGSLKTKKK